MNQHSKLLFAYGIFLAGLFSLFLSPTPATAATDVVVTSPVLESVLDSSSITLEWTGEDVSAWWVYAGSQPSGREWLNSGALPASARSISIGNLPADGSDVYVTLWFKEVGFSSWNHQVVHFLAMGADADTPRFTSPDPRYRTSVYETLYFTGPDNVSEWWLYGGTGPGRRDIFDSGSLAANTSDFRTGPFPRLGDNSYLTLWYRLGGGAWQKRPSVIRQGEALGNFDATPRNNVAFAGDTQTIELRAPNINGIDSWWVYLGSTRGALDYFNSGSLPGADNSIVASGLPLDGSDIHMTIWYRVAGSPWRHRTSVHKAATLVPPRIIEPRTDRPLVGPLQTFEFESTTLDVNQWWLYVGTTAGGSDIYDSGDLGRRAVARVENLPVDGSVVHITLWYRAADGAWQSQRSTRVSANASTGSQGVATTLKTGSTTSFAANDDGDLQMGRVRDLIRDDGLSVVTDVTMNRQWEDTAAVIDRVMTWRDARDHCSDLVLANESDWRLPTFEELFTALNVEQGSRSAYPYLASFDDAFINAGTSSGFSANNYWTSVEYNGGDYVYVDARYGSFTNTSSTTTTRGFLCTRGEEIERYYFTRGSIDVNWDFLHLLMWQDEPDNLSNRQSWSDALAYCDNLALGGLTDWRLPNINESQTLMRAADSRYLFTHQPSRQNFSDVEYHWTSTTSLTDTDEAMVDLNTNTRYNRSDDDKIDSHYARCVRDYLPPVAISQGDLEVPYETDVLLNGSRSYGYDGDIVSYEWFVNKSSTLVGAGEQITLQDVAEGVSTYRLEVTTEYGTVDTDFFIVTGTSTPNQAPTAVAAGDTQGVVDQNVQLDGSQSSDPDGVIVSWNWTSNGYYFGSGETLLHSFDSAGTYQIALEVTDDRGAIDTDEFTLVIEDAVSNRPPVAISSSVTTDEDVDIEIVLQATDPDGNSGLQRSIQTFAAHGIVYATPNPERWLYVPDRDYHGTDEFKFTVNDGQLSSNIATVSITISSVNDAPRARAGTNKYADLGQAVQLDAGNSWDDTGISSWNWEVDGTSIGTSESINWSGFPVGESSVTLTVTDAAGLSSSDTLNVYIDGPVDPEVIVSEVVGTTAIAGGSAMFSLSLNQAPTNDVVVSVASSNPAFGITDVSEVRFTPATWDESQQVVVRSAQDVGTAFTPYNIILGAVVSDDPDWQGLDPADVPMPDLQLVVGAPISTLVLPEMPYVQKMEIDYNGRSPVTWSLDSGPTGMTIDERAGVIVWEPVRADVGVSPVSVRATYLDANDAEIVSVENFDVEVVSGSPVPATSLFRFLDPAPGSDGLNGLRFRFSGNVDPTFIVEKASDSVLDSLPPEFVPITGAFYSLEQDIDNNEIDLMIPQNLVKDDEAIGAVSLVSYSTETGIWEKTGFRPRTEKYNNVWYWAVTLDSLRSLSAIVIDEHPPLLPAAGGSQQDASVAAQVVNTDGISCVGVPITREGGSSNPDWTTHMCTAEEIKVAPNSDELVQFFVTGFGDTTGPKPLTRDNVSVEEFMTWVRDARLKLDALQIANQHRSLQFYVYPYGAGGGAVTTGSTMRQASFIKIDNGSVARFNSREAMRSIVVHEMFHHAQATTLYTTGGGERLLGPSITQLFRHIYAGWLIEGQATWFEDFVYDANDSYRRRFDLAKPLRLVNPILEGGLATPYSNYATVFFWKLLHEKCVGFETNLSKFMFDNYSPDETMIEDLRDFIDITGCGFGPQFGGEAENNSSLESAMAFYEYATRRHDIPWSAISLLDSNEPDADSSGNGGVLFNKVYLGFESDDWSINTTTLDHKRSDPFIRVVWPAGAHTSGMQSMWEIAGAIGDQKYEELEEAVRPYLQRALVRQQEMVVKVDILPGQSGYPLKVGIHSESPNFIGNTQIDGKRYEYFDTDDGCEGEYVFGLGEAGPGIVTVVNPNDTPIFLNKFEFHIRDIQFQRDDSREIVLDRTHEAMYVDTAAQAGLELTFDEAVAHCESSEHAGFDDWRLIEMFKLLAAAYDTRVAGTLQHVKTAEEYWSIDPVDVFGNTTDYASTVLGSGYDFRWAEKTEQKSVMCVRFANNSCIYSQQAP